MVTATVALVILAVLCVAAAAVIRRDRRVAERAHWDRWEAECRRPYDWQQDGV